MPARRPYLPSQNAMTTRNKLLFLLCRFARLLPSRAACLGIAFSLRCQAGRREDRNGICCVIAGSWRRAHFDIRQETNGLYQRDGLALLYYLCLPACLSVQPYTVFGASCGTIPPLKAGGGGRTPADLLLSEHGAPALAERRLKLWAYPTRRARTSAAEQWR